MAHTHTACNGSIHVRPSFASLPYLSTLTGAKSGGGMPISTNRTLWPVTGGAVGVQPGWFPGHSSAFFYINLGNGTVPVNYSYPMQPVFQITGPNNLQYEGSWCLPQVPLPVNFTAKIGQNATIQIIETAQHGASLYNVSDTSALDMTWFSLFWCLRLTSDIYSVSISRSRTPAMCRKSTKRTVSTPQTLASISFTAPLMSPQPAPHGRHHG